MINKHLSHEDDIDVGKDEQIVEIERKLSMRMKMLLKLTRMIWMISTMRMMRRNGVTLNSQNLIHCFEISYDDDCDRTVTIYRRMGVDRGADCLMNSCWRGSCRDIPG